MACLTEGPLSEEISIQQQIEEDRKVSTAVVLFDLNSSRLIDDYPRDDSIKGEDELLSVIKPTS